MNETGLLKQWDRQIVWHAFTQMAEYEPLIIERGHECTLVDVDGNSYIDGVSSLWCNVHGHNHPVINRAIKDQIDKVSHVTSLGMSCETTVRLAKQLVDHAPSGLGHVFFSSDGASAIEVGLKMAFQYWQQKENPEPQRTRYVALADAYHGDTLGSVSVGGVARFHQMFDPLLFDVLRLPAPDTYRAPSNVPAEQLAAYYLAPLEKMLSERGREVAALVIEPLVQCAAGMIMHPTGFLEGIRRITKEHGVLLIADEVAVGMGRTGKLFACQHEDVAPDLLCLGKGLTSGYLPMSATLATTEIWNAFLGTYADSKTLFHGHTFGGNPLAAAAALATLEIFEKENTLARVEEKARRLATHLKRIETCEQVGDVRQRGMIGAIELVKNVQTREPFPWDMRVGQQVCDKALQQGVWLRPLGNVIVIMPPLNISMDQLDQICEVVESGIRELG